MREIAVPTFISLFQPISTTLEQLSQIGVGLVELHGDSPGSHIDLKDSAQIAALKTAVANLPLDIHSIHCTFSQPAEEAWDISQPDAAKRRVAVDNMGRAIRATAPLGAHHITIHPGARVRTGDSLRHSRESLAHLVGIAEEVNAKIAVENLPPEYIGGSLADMQILLEGLNPAVVGFCLDTGHAMLGQNAIEEYIHALGGRLRSIHWHSNDGLRDLHLVPDIAEPRWQNFLRGLDAAGYERPITLEAAPPITMSLKEALAPLKAALSKATASSRQ